MTDTAARSALKFAKAYTPLGPDNQSSGQTAPLKPWTPTRDPMSKHLCKTAVTLLKKMAPAQNCSMSDVLDYAREVMKAKAGNCFEQSALACLLLSEHPEQPVFRLVMLAPPADHVSVVLGQLPDEDGYFPDDFSDWDANAVIVDPWVGICVKARHYPEIWRMKLDVMGAVGEELPSSSGGWGKANHASWRTAPTSHRKVSYTG